MKGNNSLILAHLHAAGFNKMTPLFFSDLGLVIIPTGDIKVDETARTVGIIYDKYFDSIGAFRDLCPSINPLVLDNTVKVAHRVVYSVTPVVTGQSRKDIESFLEKTVKPGHKVVVLDDSLDNEHPCFSYRTETY